MAKVPTTKPREDQDFTLLAFKLECALPAILFCRDLPVPLGVVVILVCLTVGLAQLSERSVREAEHASKRFGRLILWGSLNSIVCGLGLLVHVWWLHKPWGEHWLTILKLIGAYTGLILILRSVEFWFVTRSKR
jgi:hypothetical protein